MHHIPISNCITITVSIIITITINICNTSAEQPIQLQFYTANGDASALCAIPRVSVCVCWIAFVMLYKVIGLISFHSGILESNINIPCVPIDSTRRWCQQWRVCVACAIRPPSHARHNTLHAVHILEPNMR